MAARRTSPLSARWLRRTGFHALVLAGLIFAGYLFLVAAPFKGSMAFDVVAYHTVDLAQLYHGSVGDLGFFAYAPPVAVLLATFSVLPWIAFVAGWYALLLAAVLYIGRRDALVVLAFPPVAIDLYHGNIHLLLAAAMIIGFRFPAAWAIVLLTKVTPGIGLLWFVVRREWRQLAVATGATLGIAAATWILLPDAWPAWFDMLIASAAIPPPWPALPVPLWLRLPVAALIVSWGARRNARWTVPVAAALSVPALWPGAFAILAACWPLVRGTQGRSDVTDEAADYHAPDARPRGKPEPAAA